MQAERTAIMTIWWRRVNNAAYLLPTIPPAKRHRRPCYPLRRVHRGSLVLCASQRASFTAEQAQGYRQRTAIPYKPLAMTFVEVTYSVPLPKVCVGQGVCGVGGWGG